MRALRQRIAEKGEMQEAAGASPEARTRRKKPSVAAHPAFTAMLTIWGGAVGAGSIGALPAHTVAQLAAMLGLNGLGQAAFATIACLAAMTGAIVALGVAKSIRQQTSAEKAGKGANLLVAQDIEPIDPVLELGSDSLDAPIECEPFAATHLDAAPDEDDAGDAAPLLLERPTRGDAVSCDGNSTDLPDAAPQCPREVDLAEFAAMPGRNAVWIEEPGVETGQPVPRETATDKLRAIPTADLSLVQMVERFAAALHERQDRERRDPSGNSARGRDAALAEALKALSMFGGGDLDKELEWAGEANPELRASTRELRDALAKLQDLRGAA